MKGTLFPYPKAQSLQWGFSSPYHLNHWCRLGKLCVRLEIPNMGDRIWPLVVTPTFCTLSTLLPAQDPLLPIEHSPQAAGKCLPASRNVLSGTFATPSAGAAAGDPHQAPQNFGPPSSTHLSTIHWQPHASLPVPFTHMVVQTCFTAHLRHPALVIKPNRIGL